MFYKLALTHFFMPKREGELIISETGNWNVASQYADSIIMDSLRKCRDYERIARMGYLSIVDEMININPKSKDELKFDGLRYLISELIVLIESSKEFLKKENTKKIAERIEEQLKKINNYLPNVYKINKGIGKGYNFRLIPHVYETVLNRVSELRSELNYPLNKNHLIFTDKDEFQVDDFKGRLKSRVKNKG